MVRPADDAHEHAKSLGEQIRSIALVENALRTIDPVSFKIQDATLATTKLSKNACSLLSRRKARSQISVVHRRLAMRRQRWTEAEFTLQIKAEFGLGPPPFLLPPSGRRDVPSQFGRKQILLI